MRLELDLPAKPALPSSYFWTWDHSVNFVLDDPGAVPFGCYPRYLKRPETFVEEYRRLTDLAADLGVKGVLIWGFVRDSHGGVEAGKQVAAYAASKGVAIMPGVGTTWYGGMVYEGDHPFALETFLRQHPDACMIAEDGRPTHFGTVTRLGVCPSHPAYLDWLGRGMQWLFEEFEIGGVNLENGDFLVCHCPRCRAQKAHWPQDDPDFLRLQAMSYGPALEAVSDRLKDSLCTYATYCGFVPGRHPEGSPFHHANYMGCARPAMFDRLPEGGLCQWTLTHMIHQSPVPMTALLDDPAPPALYEGIPWTAGLRPPASNQRHVGFLHQASQWHWAPYGMRRYQHMIGAIKEGCLRAWQAGLEGVCIHGEVSPRYTPWLLNYLAFSHFIHWPEDTLRGFGRRTLGRVLNGPEEGEAFIEILSHHESGSITDEQRQDAARRAAALHEEFYQHRGSPEELERWKLWHWLDRVVHEAREPHTVSFF